MPARHTLHVALTKPLVQHVLDQVEAGRYGNASEVVRRALHLLIAQGATTADRSPARLAAAAARHNG